MGTGQAFRHVNDAIRQLAPEGSETDTFQFFCECGDLQCHEFVSLTLLEFEGRRAASPPAPIFAAHEPIAKPSHSRQGHLTSITDAFRRRPSRLPLGDFGRMNSSTSSVVQPGSTVR
jgi:hypothetical protein